MNIILQLEWFEQWHIKLKIICDATVSSYMTSDVRSRSSFESDVFCDAGTNGHYSDFNLAPSTVFS